MASREENLADLRNSSNLSFEERIKSRFPTEGKLAEIYNARWEEAQETIAKRDAVKQEREIAKNVNNNATTASGSPYATLGTNENSLDKMRDKYRNKLMNVISMLNTEGPIISTWIKFQIGLDNPIIFDSRSTDQKQNLIADLNFDKTCAGTANKFTINIQYDPFNMGQETTDIIEKLDEYVANAMSVDFENDTTTLRGKLQYGYNSVSDDSLVSPEYTFYLTNANTTVKFDSGITKYTFEGCSTLAIDCNNNTNFGAINEWKLMDIIEWTLYYWYGDQENKPAHTGDAPPTDNIYKYKIDIPDDVYNDCPQKVSVAATTGMTPWEYCQSVLDANPLTQPEIESGNYDNLAELSYAQKPRYIMSIDDATHTIHVNHIVPKYTNDRKTKLEAGSPSLDFTFTWSDNTSQSKNLVIGWQPEVNTITYLIRKARMLRAYDQYVNAKNSTDLYTRYEINDKFIQEADDLNEMYDAQLQIIGIPEDPPLGMEIGVKPMILETVSRTAGIYIITGCTDVINSNGVYISTLKLFRVRGFDDQTIKLVSQVQTEQEILEQAIKDNEESQPQHSSDGWSGGGRLTYGAPYYENGYNSGGGGRWWRPVVAGNI